MQRLQVRSERVEFESSKHREPSSRETPSFKSQLADECICSRLRRLPYYLTWIMVRLDRYQNLDSRKQLPMPAAFLVLALVAHTILALSAWAECSTNHPFEGVVCYSETRKEPPTRLFVAEVDLTNPNLRLRVAPGGADPDGPGPWQTTLMTPTRIASREGFDLVVNGDFF